MPTPLRRPATIDRSIGLQTVKGRAARQRRSWAVPPCCFSTAPATWGGRATHGCAALLRSVVGDRTCVHATTELRRGGACQADAGPVPPFGDLRSASCCGTVLPRGGPAPALARGASSGRSEDRSYASWRELCGVKLSSHEPSEGEGGTDTPSPHYPPITIQKEVLTT